jgi:hypothetical protein
MATLLFSSAPRSVTSEIGGTNALGPVIMKMKEMVIRHA